MQPAEKASVKEQSGHANLLIGGWGVKACLPAGLVLSMALCGLQLLLKLVVGGHTMVIQRLIRNQQQGYVVQRETPPNLARVGACVSTLRSLHAVQPQSFVISYTWRLRLHLVSHWKTVLTFQSVMINQLLSLLASDNCKDRLAASPR